MPVDPFGYDYYGGLSPDQGGWVPDYGDYGEPSWRDLISQAIREGAETAQVFGAGYPPGSVNVYAPQTGYPTIPPSPGVTPAPVPTATPQGAGIQLSTTTLMLIVGGFLLFSLGKSRR